MDKIVELKEWLQHGFPQLESRIPENPVYKQYVSREIIASHDLPGLDDWLIAPGYLRFISNPDVPDGFVACGIYSPAVGESLLAMWREGDRYFWLYNQYALYIVKDSGQSIAKTQKHLDQALKLWDEGKQHVISLMGDIYEFSQE